MKITKIEVQNFKAFKETQLFEIKGNNVLVFGNNGSGKSSFYFALHAFVQSSIKTDAQCAKYFLFDGAESLLNIHAAAGFPSYIRVSTDNGNTYEFSPTLKEGNLTNKDAVIRNFGSKLIKKVTQDSFVYCVSTTGTTGARKDLPPDIKQYLSRVRKIFNQPLAVGFGISTREQVEVVGQHAEIAIVGSAMVDKIKSSSSKDLLKVVSKFTKELLF